MALETQQEKLADFLDRLHQGAKRVELTGPTQRERTKEFWEGEDTDLRLQVPGQTFTCGTEGTHMYSGAVVNAQAFIGIVAWLPNERVVNPNAKERGHLVAYIPVSDLDEAMAILKDLARLLPRERTETKKSHDWG